MKFAIGQSMPRVEDADLLRGRGRYSDDVAIDDCAHAFVLRSPHAHARIRSISTDAARANMHASVNPAASAVRVKVL